MCPFSRRIFRKFLCTRILLIHMLFLGTLAVCLPLAEPCPFLLPFLFWAARLLALALETPFACFLIMILSWIRPRKSAFVMDSLISCRLSAERTILFGEHLRICAAHFFCLPSFIFTSYARVFSAFPVLLPFSAPLLSSLPWPLLFFPALLPWLL